MGGVSGLTPRDFLLNLMCWSVFVLLALAYLIDWIEYKSLIRKI